MTTADTKRIDSKCLNDYMNSIPISNRRFFINKVVEACGQGIKKKTFYNWKSGCCRIPEFCKREIEKIAGLTVFPKELYSLEDQIKTDR